MMQGPGVPLSGCINAFLQAGGFMQWGVHKCICIYICILTYYILLIYICQESSLPLHLLTQKRLSGASFYQESGVEQLIHYQVPYSASIWEKRLSDVAKLCTDCAQSGEKKHVLRAEKG